MVLSLPPPSEWAWRAWGHCLLLALAFGARLQRMRGLESPASTRQPQPGRLPSLLKALFLHLENEDSDSQRHTSSWHEDQVDTVRGGLSTRQGSRSDAGTVPGVNILFSLFRG